MIDFLMISTREGKKKGTIEIYPEFIIKKSSDLMIRGGDFYAVWLEEEGRWSTEEQDALQLIDKELDIYAKEHKDEIDGRIQVMHMWAAGTGMVDKWHKYCQKQMRDNFHMLDEELIFSNTPVKKKDYSSKQLPYPLEEGECPAYNRLMSVLYSPEERQKIEWAIGSIVTGDSKKIQKFLVLYGAAGTGKSTVLNIIQQLFEGYYSVFDAKALGSSSNSFALEAFKTNPLVAIQHDGDLSRIEDNTRLNSLVSHELMTVNEKFKSTYSNRFKAFLFMGTNKPVKITDGRSGLIRRLIDVSPSGDKLDGKEYKTVVKQVSFELGAIAWHCKEVYLENPSLYDDYIPVSMLGASNDFYNFMLDSYFIFEKDNGVTLKSAWEMYKLYCEDAKITYPFTQRVFKEELKTYFYEYKDRYALEDGTRVRSYYEGFRKDRFEEFTESPKIEKKSKTKLIEFDSEESIFDEVCSDCPAQYATEKGTPKMKWSNVKTKLSDLNTKEIHYVRVPENHIVIDFDIPDEEGNKSYERNLEAASKWPPTYAELSKSGAGIHLHYIYSGDPKLLERIYDDHIEVKVFTGEASLRRKVTRCNRLAIAPISSGLLLKGAKKMVNFQGVKSEKALRAHIKKNLNKEFHPNTKPSMDLIFKTLEDAYNSGLKYDVSDMRSALLSFAMQSTNQADYCVKLIGKMKLKSDEVLENDYVNGEAPIAFYDVEVFPNLFLVNWKLAGEDEPVHRMINPTSEEIEGLIKYRLIGFNCRRYDNHILYGRILHYSNEALYDLSQKIISGSKSAFFGEAYNLSYTDVYDFAATKQSLKKWEIELGIHHQELGLPWDQPVPKALWEKVAEYCDNDVIATEAVFNHLKADFIAREILADLCGMTVNDTTNSLSTRIIFGTNRKPQDQFNYRDMGDVDAALNNFDMHGLDCDPEYTLFTKDGKPIFPGYKYEAGKSTYRGEEVGEGGYVYAEPGMYGNVALLDIASMHPSSTIAENLFGDIYTAKFKELRDARITIKHENWDVAETMLDGKLVQYIAKVKAGELRSKDLAGALKIVINSVYGLTAASFENPFHDPRNVDNIVAKRGALFMVNLKHEVQKRGYIVAHIKTDSIKIPDADEEIIKFVMDYGKLYGYDFEHEATYEKMCLVNNAVYIAKYKNGEWTATGAQFAVPYVFKTLFSKQPIEFGDLCETKSVTSALYLDFNEGMPDVSEEEKELAALVKKLSSDINSDDEYYKSLFAQYEKLTNEISLSTLAKKLPSDTDFDNEYYKSLFAQYEKLTNDISYGHNYHFIGKVGLFTPIKPGCGGGLLMRESENKKTGTKSYNSVGGAKGYRWMESEMVKQLGKEPDIDKSYYEAMVTDAVKTISQYGDIEWFTSDDPYISPPFSGGRIITN